MSRRGKEAGRQPMSSASTTPCASGWGSLCARPCPSPSATRCIGAASNCSCTATISVVYDRSLSHYPGFVSLLQCFAPLFDSRVWNYAQLLLLGAILAPGKRTVTAVLRIVGRGNEKRFQNYHRVLNRACWSSRAASRILLGLLVRTFAPSGPILVG